MSKVYFIFVCLAVILCGCKGTSTNVAYLKAQDYHEKGLVMECCQALLMARATGADREVKDFVESDSHLNVIWATVNGEKIAEERLHDTFVHYAKAGSREAEIFLVLYAVQEKNDTSQLESFRKEPFFKWFVAEHGSDVQGRELSFEEIETLLKEASAGGCVLAYQNLGKLYLTGDKPRLNEGFTFMKKAYEACCLTKSNAQLYLKKNKEYPEFKILDEDLNGIQATANQKMPW